MNYDDYKLNKVGDIELIKITDDDHDVLYASNDDGSIDNNTTIEVEKGVLGGKNTINVPAQNSNGDILNYSVDEYTVNGNNSGKSLFEFVAQNSNVEWSQTIVGQGTNYITTSHLSNADAGMDYEIQTKGTNATPLILANHSHPSNTITPSVGDATVADRALSKFPNAKFNIFTPGNGQYVPFTNTVPLDAVIATATGRPIYFPSIPRVSKPLNTELR
jgi:hypothetical protein